MWKLLLIKMQQKICKKCNVSLPINLFSKKAAAKDGLQPRCQPCSNVDVSEWRAKQSPERLKDLYYKRTYSLTLVQFTRLLKAQSGLCAICEKLLVLQNLTGDSAVVDHCHTTGKVRGILCNECNRGLGYFRDNAKALQKASEYLKVKEQ